MIAVALLAALAAAVLIPGGPPGIGLVVVAALMAAAAARSARRSPDLVLFGVPAVALAAVPGLVDAGWVVFLDVAAAWVFATVAVAGPRIIAPLAPALALSGVAELLPPASSRALPPLRALGIGIVVAIPFATLFLTADAAFASLADRTPRPELASLPLRIGVFVLVLLAAVGLALLARKLWAQAAPRDRRGLAPVEWALPLVVLDALFLAFVAVQVTVLFGGNGHVLRTTGLTYAEYARQGFWQLIAAATLTLVVLKGATLFARPRTGREQRLLEGLLGLLCALTIVIVASAVHRLLLYEDAFGLTRLRLAALAFSLWLGGTFALLLLLGAARRTRNFARVTLAWAGAALLAFTVANPDARIAERNVDRWRASGRIDLEYLSALSADAVPALTALPPRLRWRATADIAARLADDEPLGSANLSRARARAALRD